MEVYIGSGNGTDISGQIALYDIDRDAAKANAKIGNKIGDMSAACGRWCYTAAGSLEEALTGADFVIISILPGTFNEMMVDVHLPERLGIWQSVGDTAGPGGGTACINVFPQKLSEEFPEDTILLCCNGASWHKSKDMIIPSNNALFYIPPYTPEMDPIEQIWKEIRKKDFFNRLFPLCNRSLTVSLRYHHFSLPMSFPASRLAAGLLNLFNED